MRAPKRHQTSAQAAPAAGKQKPAQKPEAKKTALPNLRLLPVTIFVAVLMLSVRINDVWKGFSSLGSATIEINQSDAQQPPPPGGRKPGQKSPTAPDAAPAGGSAGGDSSGGVVSNPAAGANSPAPPEESGAGDGEPPT